VSESTVWSAHREILQCQTARQLRPFTTARWILENVFMWPPFSAPAETIHNAHQYGAVQHTDRVANQCLDKLLGEA
jgi:hypothetical protein